MMYTTTVTDEISSEPKKKRNRTLAWLIVIVIVVLMQWEISITARNQAQVTVERIDERTIRVTNPTNQPLTGTVVYETDEVIMRLKFVDLIGSKDFIVTGR